MGPECEEVGSFEDEDFHDFREKCWDLMKEIVFVVGEFGVYCLDSLGQFPFFSGCMLILRL